MSQGAVASGLVRVTVASGTRRVDLVLPGSVPVAELVPELARSVGLLDASTVHGGFRVVTATGARLAPDVGLTLQGVEDGGVLTVAAGVDDEPPRVYDDIAEAMSDAVEHDLQPWRPDVARRTALVAAGLLLVLGIAALFLQRGSALAAGAAGLVSLVLCVVAVVLSRAQHEREPAVLVACLATAYAVTAGLLVAALDELGTVDPLVAAGAGAMISGLVCLTGLGEGRPLLFPPVVVGAVAVGTGLLVQWVDSSAVDAGRVLTVVLVLVVLAGSVFPWLALSATGTRSTPVDGSAGPDAAATPVDPARVSADAAIAHEILLAITATVGVLLVLVAPVAVGLGVAGTLIAVAASAVVMLRTRQHHVGSEVAAGLVAGLAGLVATAVAVLVLHPEWRGTLAVVLALAGTVLLLGTMAPSAPSLRRSRLGDLLEAVALVALLPLLVVAIGLFDAVAG
jgi:type VII secretion integral membrane protein EccD